eukprot:363335-Chlamydomonas_euryale.AAC.9
MLLCCRDELGHPGWAQEHLRSLSRNRIEWVQRCVCVCIFGGEGRLARSSSWTVPAHVRPRATLNRWMGSCESVCGRGPRGGRSRTVCTPANVCPHEGPQGRAAHLQAQASNVACKSKVRHVRLAVGINEHVGTAKHRIRDARVARTA